MFSVGPNYAKLKTNLRLAVNRLKLISKRKHELAQKMRKEIADFINQGKEDRARIRVEHIIREDYSVEALELIESLCDLLLGRFDLIQQMKFLDEGLEEAVNSMLWAAPRLVTEIPEMRVISDQLTVKYGRQFVEACRENRFAKVNLKLLQKLTISTPAKSLVENYMMEIAKCHGVPFTPNRHFLKEGDVAAAEALLIDFKNKRDGFNNNNNKPGNDGGGGGGLPAISALDEAKNKFGWIEPPGPMPSAPPVLYPDVMSAAVPQGPSSLEPNLPHAVEYGLCKPTTCLVSAPKESDALFHFPDPPAYSLLVPNEGGAPVPPSQGDTQETGEDLDFEDLSRRFEQLRQIR